MLRPESRFLASAAALALLAAAQACGGSESGGSSDTPSIVLEVDAATLQRQQLEFVADEMALALRSAEPPIAFTGRGVVEDAARVRVLDVADTPRALQAIASLANDSDLAPSGGEALDIVQGVDGLIEARLTDQALSALGSQAARQSVEVVRRRIDPRGRLAIVPRGDRIIVTGANLPDIEELRRKIGLMGLLTFHLVDDSISAADVAAGRIPPGSMVANPYPEIGDSAEVVRRRPLFTGESIKDASPRIDGQTNEFVLAFRLDGAGSRTFCRLSTENLGRRFAVLLDGQVLTAPVIREPICGGSGQIEGRFTAQSANELAILLQAGALPAPLLFVPDDETAPAPSPSADDPVN